MTRFLSGTVACVFVLAAVDIFVNTIRAVVVINLEMIPCEGQTVTYIPYGTNYPSGAKMVCIGFEIIHTPSDTISFRILDAYGALWQEATILPCPIPQCHTTGRIGFCPGSSGCVPPDGDAWPIGFYHLDFLANGELVRSLPFSVGIRTGYIPLVLK